MESKSLFKTFFDPPSRDINYRFSDKGLQLALQVFTIIENHFCSESRLAGGDLPVEVSEREVESRKADFNEIARLMEMAHEAMKQVTIAVRARNPGIHASSSAVELERSWGVWDAVAVFLKSAIGAVLLAFEFYLLSNYLLAAVSMICTGIVFGGLAVGASMVVGEYLKADEETDSVKEEEGPRATAIDDHEYHWNVQDACTKAFINVIGGSILVGTLLHPSVTWAVFSAFCTLAFFGSSAAGIAIIFWEFDLGDNASEDTAEETTDISKNENNAEETALRSWFQCSHELAKALDDLMGQVAYAYSLVINFAFLSKELRDLETEVWLKKYLRDTNSLCMLVQKKYSVRLTPVVVTYIFVALIFHDRNRFVMESILKTHHFKSNLAKSKMELRSRPCCAASSFSFENHKYFNEEHRNIWKNLEFLYETRFETETYNFEIPLMVNSQFGVNKTHQIRQLKYRKRTANGVHGRNTEELDDCIFEKQLEQSGSRGLEDKRMNSDDVEKYTRRKISEFLKAGAYKKVRQNDMVDNTHGLIGRDCETEINEKIESNTREESNKLNFNSGNNSISVPKRDSTFNKIKRGAQRNVSNVPYPTKYVAKDSQNKYVNLLIIPPFEEEIETKPSNRRSMFQKLDRVHQRADEVDGCGCQDDEIPTLKELEERVEWLLDDGTKVNQWLVDLEERFKNLFLNKNSKD